MTRFKSSTKNVKTNARQCSFEWEVLIVSHHMILSVWKQWVPLFVIVKTKLQMTTLEAMKVQVAGDSTIIFTAIEWSDGKTFIVNEIQVERFLMANSN